MFSRLVCRSNPVLSSALREAGKVRAPLAVKTFHTDVDDQNKTRELIANWERCNKTYYGPERDLENFPPPKQLAQHEPVRLGFLPAKWFDALYDKTGVSGPYVFLGGLTAYCFSKEILVVDHSYFELLAFWGAFYVLVKKFGPGFGKWTQTQADKIDEKNYHGPLAETRQAFQKHVDTVDTEIAQEGRHAYMFEVQKENLDLQLEARYRQRIAQAHQAVKKRLDYQVEMLNTKKRFEQQHMVDWIVSNVIKGITPQQEKDAISSCIGNLKNLAKANAGV